MKRLNTPVVTKKTIEDMEDMSFFVHAMIFDDLLIVAQKETNCFVLKTTEGLIVIDAIWPSQRAFDAIVNAIRDVGWDPDTIRKLILTHGHVDHTGCGKWFVEKYHAETYLSRTDDVFWREHPTKPDRPETWKDYDISVYLQDGDTVTLGDKTIYVYGTPGHTPGGLSYLFPVKEAMNQKVDVALSNHTAIDNGLERIAYSQKRLSYLPNIYIIGQDGFQEFCQVFRTMSFELLKRL